MESTERKLSDSDISLLQDYARCVQEIAWQRGINKLICLASLVDIIEHLQGRGLLQFAQQNIACGDIADIRTQGGGIC